MAIIPTSSCFPLHQSHKISIFRVFHQFLSHPSSNPRFIIPNSSVFPPSVLEEETSPVLPLVEFTYVAPNSTYPDTESDDDPNPNKLIRDLLGDSSTEELGLEYYEKAKQSSEFRLHKTTLKSLFRFLVRSKKWDLFPLICEDMKGYKVFPDGLFCARIVSACISARKFRVSDLLLESFESERKIASFGYESAVRSYNKLHMYTISVDLFERMKSAGVVFNNLGGWVSIMEAYLKLRNFEKVVELFDELEASKKLDSLENPVQIYAVLLEALGKLGQGIKALERFEQMGVKGIVASASIYVSLIGSLAGIREVNIVENLVDEAVSKRMLKDPALFLKLVIMYVEDDMLESTLNVVKIMKDANLKVSDCIFCAIVNGYAKKRGLKAAADVYHDLTSQGCEPGQVTYASIINVFFRLALFSKAEIIFDEMQRKGFDRCVVAYSTMIVMYGKTGQLKEAMKLLAKMKERRCEPNAWVYNALIDLHGRAMDLRQVEKLWKEMKRRKIKADRVTYTSIIGAYSKAKEYETCIIFYEEYRKDGGEIDLAMGGIMVGVFSKNNRVDELVSLLQDMQSEGIKMDARLYRSGLNALRDAGLQGQARWLQESFEKTSIQPFSVNDRRRRKLPGLLQY